MIQTSRTESRRSLAFLAACAACVALPFLIYSGSLRAPFIFDDHTNIVDNPDIRRLENLKSRLIFKVDRLPVNSNLPTRPLTFLTFTLDYRFWKLDPAGYRLVNIAVHGLVSLAVFLFGRSLLRRASGRDPWPLAFGAALLFAAHPMNVDAVTYISNRSDSLAALFLFASLLAFDRARGSASAAPASAAKLPLVLSWTCFALSLGFKEIGASFPAMVLLYDHVFVSRFDTHQTARGWKAHVPFWLLLAGFVLFRKLYFGTSGFIGGDLEKSWTPLEYLLTQALVVWKYLKLLCWPVGQSVDHYVWPLKPFRDPKLWTAAGAWIAVSALAAVWFFRVRTKPAVALELSKSAPSKSAPRPSDPTEPPYFSGAALPVTLGVFGLAWFLIGLAPTSSFLPIYDAMVERRVYWPGFGFALMVLAVYLKIFRADLSSPSSASASASAIKKILIAMGVHILALSAATAGRNRLFLNPIELWQESARLYPTNARAFINMGKYQIERDPDLALASSLRSAELNPDSPLVYNNLGNVYNVKGDFESAIRHYEKSIRLDPKFSRSYVSLAGVHFRRREFDKAERIYLQAVELDPYSAQAWNNLGSIYLEWKDPDRARECFQRAIRADANYAEAHFNLGQLEAGLGNLTRALESFEAAHRLLPDHPVVSQNLAAVRSLIAQGGNHDAAR